MRNTPLLTLALFSAALITGAPGQAQPLDYQQPTAAMRAVLDAPALPSYSLSPDRMLLATVVPRRHRPVAELAEPVVRLAGMRLNAAARGPALIQPLEALCLRALDGSAAERPLVLPAGDGFHGLRWSPDGQRLLLARRTANGTELWVADVAKPVLRRVNGLRLNGVLEQDVAWLNGDELVVLDQLEADLSAVEQAIESLERVTAEGLGGDAAASRIAAAVSVERFGGASASAEVPGG